MSAPIIIVGGGQAAAQAVATLRARGFSGEIALYGDEPYAPYQRPPLSKACLGGEMDEARLELKPAGFYAERQVAVHCGARVAGIRPQEKAFVLADGRQRRYGALLIATGARARPLPVPGADLQGVHVLRGIDDMRHLRAGCRPGARLVIIGGGYIGLETAAQTRKMGLDVTVVEGQPRLLARVACGEISAFVRDLHERHGTVIRTGIGVAAIRGVGRVRAVALADGTLLPADLVLAAVGAVPDTALAAAAGLALDNGVMTDDATRTSIPDIFAAGDVASFPSRRYGRRVRLESVQNAFDQATAAATVMAGGVATYDPVPWFWSDQHGVKLQIAGLLDGFTRSEREGDPAAGRFSIRYYAGERLLAVCSVNDPRSHMRARRELAG